MIEVGLLVIILVVVVVYGLVICDRLNHQRTSLSVLHARCRRLYATLYDVDDSVRRVEESRGLPLIRVVTPPVSEVEQRLLTASWQAARCAEPRPGDMLSHDGREYRFSGRHWFVCLYDHIGG